MNTNKYAFFAVVLFLLVFALSFSGTIVGVKLAHQNSAYQLAKAAGKGKKQESQANFQYINSLFKNSAENWCSTSYATVKGGSNRGIDIKDCKLPEAKDNPIDRAIQDLHACILNDMDFETGSPNAIGYDEVYKSMCIGKSAEEVRAILASKLNQNKSADKNKKNKNKKDTNGKPQTSQDLLNKLLYHGDGKSKKIIIPAYCEDKFKKVLSLKKEYLEKISKKATEKDFKSCTFRGVAVCFKASEQDKNSKYKYKCISKKQAKSGSGTRGPQAPPYSPIGDIGSTNPNGGLGDLSKIFGGGSKNDSSSSSGTRTPSSDYCKNPPKSDDSWISYIDSWWKRREWEKACGKQSSANKSAQKPKKAYCSLELSDTEVKFGQKVSVVWTSGNASQVILVGPGFSSNSRSGSKEFVVTDSAKIKLIALSSDGEKTVCEKEVKLKSGPEDNGKPSIACTPEKLAKGEQAVVSWSCPYQSELYSSSFGATGSSGSKQITIDSDKSFTVACKMPDGKKVENSCKVSIEKPKFEIIAYPQKVKKGESARVSWASLNASCSVSGPQGFLYNDPIATVVVIPFPKDSRHAPGDKAEYIIACANEKKSVSIELEAGSTFVPGSAVKTAQTTKANNQNTNKRCPVFTTYYSVGDKGGEIYQIQKLLKQEGLYQGAIDGIFDAELEEAVRSFQAKYADDVLKPWGLTYPTGKWYQSTRKKANEIMGCREDALRLDNGNII